MGEGVVSVIAVLLSWFLFGFACETKATERTPVDLLLVIAIDTSSSVSDSPYDDPNSEIRLQRRGVAQALSSPQVARVLEQCNNDGVGITYVEWAGDQTERQVLQVLDWRRLLQPSDLLEVARFFEERDFRPFQGFTDISSALTFSQELIDQAPFAAERRVILISGDGRQNVTHAFQAPFVSTYDPDVYWPPHIRFLTSARDAIVAKGTLIEALVITNDEWERQSALPLIDYFNQFVIGGTGAAALEVRDFYNYGTALEQMLIRELNNCRL